MNSLPAITGNSAINKYSHALFLPMLLLGLLSACSSKVEPASGLDDNNTHAQSPSAESVFLPRASIQEIMQFIIDPNADEVWNAVKTTITAAGIDEHAPASDAEWNALKGHAITLAEASNLLLIQGRQVAAPGASTSAVEAELSAADIQKSVQDFRQEFVAHAHALHDATQQAIVAIDAHDSEALVRAGGVIDHACESCHARFWYPGERTPVFPPLNKTQ